MIRPRDYFNFAEKEYLADFVKSGGAAVKFVVPFAPATPSEVEQLARTSAERNGYLYVRVDASKTKVHMIEHIFHQIARQVDWSGMARSLVRQTMESMHFPTAPEDVTPTLASIARYNRYDINELRRDFNRRLQEDVFQDYEMAQEFKIAMIRLCQAEIDSDPIARTSREAVLEWLRGELKMISRLKEALIFQKIARHNARHLLFSFARWIRKLGHVGLFVDLDITRCTNPQRSSDGEVNYTKATALDVYEVLRQLVDATDELTSSFVLVTCAPEFLTDPVRGLDGYYALKLRIWDEVRDKNRSNPLSALIRLSPEAPALILAGP